MRVEIATSNKGLYKNLPRTVTEVRRMVSADRQREVWDGEGDFLSFVQRRIDSLDALNQVAASTITDAILRNYEWRALDPRVRRELIRRWRESRREEDGKPDARVHRTKDDMGHGKSDEHRKPHTRPKQKRDKPRPAKHKPKPGRKGKICVRHRAGPHGKVVYIRVSRNAWPAHQKHGDAIVADKFCKLPGGGPKDPPGCHPPDPPEWPCIPDPIPTGDPEWTSGLGFFVGISDLKYNTYVPPVYDENPYVFGFEEQPDGFLHLGPGEEWTSEWIEGQIIRGLSVDCSGTYRLNYVTNGSFEL
jgi:hypothetical protein